MIYKLKRFLANLVFILTLISFISISLLLLYLTATQIVIICKFKNVITIPIMVLLYSLSMSLFDLIFVKPLNKLYYFLNPDLKHYIKDPQ